MLPERHRLAHVLLLSAMGTLSNGCAAAHTRDRDDGGPHRDAPIGDAAETRDDASLPLDGGGVRFDAGGPAAACQAQDALAGVCVESVCDGLGTWHWQGDTCFHIDCGACVGMDCGAGWNSLSACESAHASCDATLCRATRGTWLWWAEECGHFICGLHPPRNCETGFPVCDCGPSARFEAGVGCVPAEECPMPEPLSREGLCNATGGAWGSICCDSVCGAPCLADCLSDACDCGVGRVMDNERGCIEAARCYEPLLGESCAHRSSRCGEGTICCDSCGGAGCSGRPVCTAPICDADPRIDVCGNRLDAP